MVKLEDVLRSNDPAKELIHSINISLGEGTYYELKDVSADALTQLNEYVKIGKVAEKYFANKRNSSRKIIEQASLVCRKLENGIGVYEIEKDRYDMYKNEVYLDELTVNRILRKNITVAVIDSNESILASNFMVE